MNIFATALLPIFLLILLGYLFNWLSFPNQPFWPLAARVTYFVLLPALLIKTMATAELNNLPFMDMALALTLAISIIGTLLLLLRSRLPMDGAAFTSLFQGGIRQNSYVGLAATAGLLGESQLVFAAIALAVQIPVVNFWSVAVLSRFGASAQNRSAAMGADPRGSSTTSHSTTSRSTNIGGTAIAIARNPLILACAVGIALNPLLNWLDAGEFPQFVDLSVSALLEVTSILGRAALPFGLLTVGAGLRLVINRSAFTSVSVAIVVKLLLYPVIAAALCWLFGVRGTAYSAVLIFAALPTSTSSYILAREMGGDHELMAAILTVETLLAMVSMPLILIILG